MAGSLLLLLEAAASIGGMCYLTYRHLPRWMDRVLTFRNLASYI